MRPGRPRAFADHRAGAATGAEWRSSCGSGSPGEVNHSPRAATPRCPLGGWKRTTRLRTESSVAGSSCPASPGSLEGGKSVAVQFLEGEKSTATKTQARDCGKGDGKRDITEYRFLSPYAVCIKRLRACPIVSFPPQMVDISDVPFSHPQLDQ